MWHVLSICGLCGYVVAGWYVRHDASIFATESILKSDMTHPYVGGVCDVADWHVCVCEVTLLCVQQNARSSVTRTIHIWMLCLMWCIDVCEFTRSYLQHKAYSVRYESMSHRKYSRMWHDPTLCGWRVWFDWNLQQNSFFSAKTNQWIVHSQICVWCVCVTHMHLAVFPLILIKLLHKQKRHPIPEYINLHIYDYI